MKQFIIFLVIFFSFISFVFPQKIVNLGSIEYPPYTGKHLKNEGFVTEMTREAYKRVGYKVNISYYPWSRAFDMAKKGKNDGIVNVWERVERMSWILFSDPMPGSELVFYKRKGIKISFDGINYLSLKPYNIGACLGYANPEKFELVKDQLKIQFVTHDEQNLMKLKTGRIDLALIDKFVAQYILTTHIPDAIQALDYISIPRSIEPSRVGISKKTSDAERKLVDFNKGLMILKREGGIEAILVRHGFR